MRKLNNKGFAISTLIYGLAIMGIMIVAILMATMSQTRANTTSLVKTIERDLNRFSRTETTFKPVGSDIQSQEYIVPTSGWYRIELWGTQGGGNGGRGAYTSGIIELKEGDVIYFYVGKHKSSGGGYASEVRARAGAYDDDLSYETRIMSAAGGGSISTAWGGTLYGYDANMNSKGGYIKSQTTNGTFGLYETTAQGNTTNGTLIGLPSGYQVSTHTSPSTTGSGSFMPSVKGTNGGGDGHFPSNDSSTGGASYIAGYAGCYGISKGKNTNSAIMKYYERVYVEEDTVVTRTYKDGDPTATYYFVDGIMMPGVNDGDGFAKIERVAEKIDDNSKLKRRNSKFNSVKAIKYCNDTNTGNIKITSSISGGTRINTVEGSSSCKTIEYSSAQKLDEIAVFHTTSGQDYKNATISVSSDGNSWTTIRGNGDGTQLSETETVTGYRASAYQYDVTGAIPSRGNYIIQPVLSENKVLTAAPSAETNANPITIEYYKGEKRQLWTIELITDKKISPGYVEGNPSTYEYKIIELARYKALSITQDENIVYNTVSAIDKFNDKARNEPQIWKVIPVGNGTYTIRTVISGSGRGNLIAQTNTSISDALNQIIIGKDNKDTARFKLIQVDYSSN